MEKLWLRVNQLDDTSKADIIRCVGVSFETRHWPNYNNTEGTTALTQVLNSVCRVKLPLVT